MHDPCGFLYKTKTKKGSVKINTTFLGTMSQPCWDYKPISQKKKKNKMIEYGT